MLVPPLPNAHEAMLMSDSANELCEHQERRNQGNDDDVIQEEVSADNNNGCPTIGRQNSCGRS